MLEVQCLTVDPADPSLRLSIEVELDGFRIGSTSAKNRQRDKQPRWEETFPVAGNGRSLVFRATSYDDGQMSPSGRGAKLIGEGRVDLQALLNNRPEGQAYTPLLTGQGRAGILHFSYRSVQSPTRVQRSDLAREVGRYIQPDRGVRFPPREAELSGRPRNSPSSPALPSRPRSTLHAVQSGPVLSPATGRSLTPASQASSSQSRPYLPAQRRQSLPKAVEVEERIIGSVPIFNSGPRVAPVARCGNCCWDAANAEVPQEPKARSVSPSSNAGTPMPQSTKSNRSVESDQTYKFFLRGRSRAGWSPGAFSPSPGRTASTNSGASNTTRLLISEKGREDLQELMRSKDKLRFYAERPFKERSLPHGSQLGFDDFKLALREFLQDLDMSVPMDPQMRALFDKHCRRTGDVEGIGCEDFEALLFRLLCFLRVEKEVEPQKRDRTASEERDKRWREEFIQRNCRKFQDVYEVKQQLGKGSFGTVHLVTHKTQRDSRNEKRVRVCKMISKAKAKAAKTPESKVREEFAVLKQLDHPHVLRIFEDFEDEDNFYLLMEPCRGGDLTTYVKTLELHQMDPRTYEFWVAKVMQHTLSAVAYCHSKAVIHKDLKPENVMLSTPPDTDIINIHVVVVDFGLAEMFSHPTDRSDVISGTPPFMAPEVWQGNFSKSCDIWSIGCMLFFLLSGRLPFTAPSVKEFARAVLIEPDWSLMGGATQEAQSICKHMLRKMEHERPTAQTALRDKWFVGMNLVTGGDFKSLDRGHIDSLLSVGERSEFQKFVTRFVATQIDASQQGSANETFRTFDADGDGLLSREELRQGLSSFGASPEVVEQVVNELDIGNTGQVSYTAFLAGVMDLRAKNPGEQDKLLSIAWDQFLPDEHGRVKASVIQDSLAMRGLVVADLPEGFLAALHKDSRGFIDFKDFKELLLSDHSGKIARHLSQDRHRGGKLLRWMMRWFQV